MKIRLMGLPAEVDPTLKILQETRTLDLLQVDGPYPNRGDSRLVRVYIEAQLRDQICPCCEDPDRWP
jgi:hypothetical protein